MTAVVLMIEFIVICIKINNNATIHNFVFSSVAYIVQYMYIIFNTNCWVFKISLSILQ